MNGEDHVLAYAQCVLPGCPEPGRGGARLGAPHAAVVQRVADPESPAPVVRGAERGALHGQARGQEDVGVETPVARVETHVWVVGCPRDTQGLRREADALLRRAQKRVLVDGDPDASVEIERLPGRGGLRAGG